MTFKSLLAAAATVALLSGGFAYAQAPAAGAKPAEAKPAGKPRSAKSIECSKQADAKGLHGKERRKFRRECRKG